MDNSKFTFIIIPQNDDHNWQFSIQSYWILFFAIFFFFICVGIIGFSFYSIPKLKDYNNLETKYNQTLHERLSVMNLLDDLEHLKYMDMQIRKSLGADFDLEHLQVDTGKIYTDTFEYSEKSLPVSFIGNIPSHLPLDGFITQRMNISSVIHDQNHYGIDITAVEGDPVYASATGIVIFSGWTYDLGNIVILHHNNGYFTHYGHLQNFMTKQRDYIKRGDVIGLAGSTGITTGPHLHFEIWKKGEVMNPLDFFPSYLEKDLSPKFNEEN